MISEFFLGLAQAIVQWIMGTLPTADSAQSLIVSANNFVAPILVGGANLGAWFPWLTLTGAFAAVSAFYFAAFAVKVFRQLFAHVPLFGGSG